MDDKQKIMVGVVIIMTALVLIITMGAPFLARAPMVKKAVIENLKKDKGYSPSPYGPGFDPDQTDVTEYAGW